MVDLPTVGRFVGGAGYAPLSPLFPQQRTFTLAKLRSLLCHHGSQVDLLITSSAHSSSTRHLGLMSKG
jgi:hypothetical protein